MDKYNVSLTSRALWDLDDIYVYIAQTLLVPQTAIALVEKIEKEVLSLKKCPTAFQSGKQIRMLTGNTDSFLLVTILLFTGWMKSTNRHHNHPIFP